MLKAMSSGENLPNMSERGSGEDASHSRNCLGHQFDPGSNSKSINKTMNLVGTKDEMENHAVNGHDIVSEEEEEDNEKGNNGRFVDMFLNHATCNGSVLVHDTSNGSVLMHDSMDVNVETSARIDKTRGYKLQNGPSNSHGCGSFVNGGCCVKPKQLDPSRPKCLQKMKKKCAKQQSPQTSRLDLPREEPLHQPMQPHNGNMHNPNVDNQQNGEVGSNVKASGLYCSPCRPNSRPQSLWLPQVHRENRVLNGVENRQFDFDLFDMVDEGAVCDYDKFLSEEHNSPSDNSRSEETDCDFLNYHFPSTHLDCLGVEENSPKRMSKQCQYFSNSNLGHISKTVVEHSDTRVPDLSTVGDVDFDNSDYLKLFDEVDGEHYSAEEEEEPAAETWEDTGDFIDTDLPTRSPGLLSSSAGSSSSLSEEECASQLFYNHTYETKENDLSLIRFNTEVMQLHVRSFEDDRDAEDNLYSPGNASISSSERQRTGVNHHQSSESENGEDSVSNCDVNDMCFEGGAASLDIAASSRNIQISELHNGAGGGYCLTYNASLQPDYAGFVHTDYIRGVTADCGGDPSVSCHAEQPVPPPGSASFLHSLNGVCCGVNLSVNNLSSNSNTEHSSRGCHVPVSNFQNDKSNNQQKVFIKFPISSQDRKRTIGHIKRDSSHLGSPNSPEDLDSSQLEDEAVDLPLDRYEYQQRADFTEQMVMIAAEMARTRVNAESGVSEPIYEDIEAVPEMRDTENVAASGLPVDGQKPVEMTGRKLSLKVTPRRKERRSSSIGRSGIEKVMIWNEYEAYLLQVKQIATSACGPTAVLNVLKAFDICVDKDEVCKHIHTNLRDELGCIPKYLFSRAVAGTTAEDLLSGIESLTQGKIRGRFFHFWPTRDVQLLKWLGSWMKKGAVPLATLNLQKGVKTGWTIPDAWHHQMVYGVSSKGLYLTNPLENVSEETVLEQLVSDSVLLVRRQDVVNRFREETDLGEIIRHPDDRWRTMNVLGQVVNVLRESNRPHPVYRAQLTSHISIPAVYKAGITLFVQGDSDLWQELLCASDLPIKSPA